MQTTATGAWAGASFHAPYGDRWYSLGSLYHYQVRWYSPVLGRFLSPDPIVPEPGSPQSLRRYAYSLNNPLRYTKSSGYACIGRLLS